MVKILVENNCSKLIMNATFKTGIKLAPTFVGARILKPMVGLRPMGGAGTEALECVDPVRVEPEDPGAMGLEFEPQY